MSLTESLYPDRRIDDVAVFPIGFGVMRLAMEGRPDDKTAIRTIHAALDVGVRLLDTAINYGSNGSELGYSEDLVARALRAWSGDADDVLVIGKGGNLRTDDLPFVQDGSPANLRRSCELSLRALNIDCFGLYLLHSIDPSVPLTESMEALGQLQNEGKIKRVGISNAGRRQIVEARSVVDIVAVENQFSPWDRRALPIIVECESAETAFISWSPLGGESRAKSLGDDPSFRAIARDRGVSPQQVALAWALAVSPAVIPIPAARRPETILDSLQAVGLKLSEDEVDTLTVGLTS